MPFAAMSAQEPNQLMESINKPAQSPEEFTERKALWQTLVERVNSDPNLRNAMMTMGMQMMQPVSPGQNAAGHVGQALGQGFTAYQAGEFSQYEQGQKERENVRKDTEVEALSGRQKAETAAVQQATELSKKLETSQIEKAGLEVQGLKHKLDTAKSEEEVVKIERELRKRKAEIARAIPDAKLRAAAEAELDEALSKVQESRARAKYYTAGAGLSTAKSDMERKEIEALPTDTEELRQYFTKSGKYATSSSTSGVVQQGNFWGSIYDKLPADDSNKKGKTREQYMAHMLKMSNEKSIAETYAKLVAAGVDDPEILEPLREALRNQAGARAAPKPAAGGQDGWTDMGGGYRYKVKPDGTRQIERAPMAPGGGGSGQ